MLLRDLCALGLAIFAWCVLLLDIRLELADVDPICEFDICAAPVEASATLAIIAVTMLDRFMMRLLFLS